MNKTNREGTVPNLLQSQRIWRQYNPPPVIYMLHTEEQDRQCVYTSNIQVCSHDHCCFTKERSITYSDSVSVACLAGPYISSFSQKQHNFLKKLLNIKCAFWFSLQVLSETCLILRGIQQDIIKNTYQSSCKIFKKYQNIKFCQNLSSGSQGVPCGEMDKQTHKQTWWS
jgi:hypothetical protein